jgi:hypothetical protein
MPSRYIVKEGDHISGIADASGFSDYKTLWNDSNNSALKALRVNPNVLYPGDSVYVPDLVPSEFSKPTDQMHKFIVQQDPLVLRLVLEDLYEKPIAKATCMLSVEGAPTTATTDDDGKLEQAVSPSARSGNLVIRNGDTPFEAETFPLKIGFLDPVEEVSGQRVRLFNLGYYLGNPEKQDDEALESAVEEFQCDNNLTVDGDCGPATRAKLKQVHGS